MRSLFFVVEGEEKRKEGKGEREQGEGF